VVIFFVDKGQHFYGYFLENSKKEKEIFSKCLPRA